MCIKRPTLMTTPKLTIDWPGNRVPERKIDGGHEGLLSNGRDYPAQCSLRFGSLWPPWHRNCLRDNPVSDANHTDLWKRDSVKLDLHERARAWGLERDEMSCGRGVIAMTTEYRVRSESVRVEPSGGAAAVGDRVREACAAGHGKAGRRSVRGHLRGVGRLRVGWELWWRDSLGRRVGASRNVRLPMRVWKMLGGTWLRTGTTTSFRVRMATRTRRRSDRFQANGVRVARRSGQGASVRRQRPAYRKVREVSSLRLSRCPEAWPMLCLSYHSGDCERARDPPVEAKDSQQIPYAWASHPPPVK